MAIIPIFIPHAGCPHKCVFCNQKTISGEQVATVENAKAQIAKWRQWIQPSEKNEAAFYGGTFTALPVALQKELLALTDELIAQGVIGWVRISTRPDYINEAELLLLRNHNVMIVELGVQSMDDAVLKRAERGHTAADVVHAMKLLQKHNFITGMQLMVGLPGQTQESIERTIKDVVRLKPTMVRIYPVLVLKGTKLADEYAAGRYKPLTLDEAVKYSAQIYASMGFAHIGVIRIGLQPDDELCADGNIIAGPFHPSMGLLVKGKVMHGMMLAKIILEIGEKMQRDGVTSLHKPLEASYNVLIRCMKAVENETRGLKNCNLAELQKNLPNSNIFIQAVDMEIAGGFDVQIIDK